MHQCLPHTEYASQVWDPHIHEEVQSGGGIQKLALQICLGHWGLGYDDFLIQCNLPSLKKGRALFYEFMYTLQ